MQLEIKILHILFCSCEKQCFILENLEARFFEDKLNALIFSEAKKLFLRGEEIDPVIVLENLKTKEATSRLADIVADESLSVQAQAYCTKLFKNHLEKLIKCAKNEEDFRAINELREHFLYEEDKIYHISSNVENFEERYKNAEKSAIYTYWEPFDNIIGSFKGGDYIALGAATGMGKTAIALNLARQVCIQDKTVLYFSLEMPLDQLQNRFVCMNEDLSASKFRSRGFNLVEFTKYKQGLEHLKQWSLYIVSDFNLTVEKMRFYLQYQKKKQLDFVILDYLGLMSGYGNKSSYERTTMLSRKMKLLAGEFNIPILVLLQLNRDLKTRDNKRPKLSDIRDSGAIEQDADFVVFAHREGYYNEEANQNELELIIAKNRHGANNKTIKLNFDLKTQLITCK